MDEKDLLNSILDNAISEGEYDDLDQMLFDNYFGETVSLEDLSRIKTDKYGDAGNDYIFFTFNRNLILDINDIEEFDTAEGGNRIDLYFVQIKNTTKLDSNVPNKFIEFSTNLIGGKTTEHYNEEVNENIVLFSNLVKKYALKAKFIRKSTHNRRERSIHGHRGGSRGRFYYRITTFEERPWDARDPHKTTFMALSYAIGLSI